VISIFPDWKTAFRRDSPIQSQLFHVALQIVMSRIATSSPRKALRSKIKGAVYRKTSSIAELASVGSRSNRLRSSRAVASANAHCRSDWTVVHNCDQQQENRSDQLMFTKFITCLLSLDEGGDQVLTRFARRSGSLCAGDDGESLVWQGTRRHPRRLEAERLLRVN